MGESVWVMVYEYGDFLTVNLFSKLKEHQSPTPSKWRENAEWRIKNRAWLRHSQHIAMMMLDKMEQLHMLQKQLS